MKKDVIYIDIEDDITSVIDKLKNSEEKIVAMVPPKGNAVLQSVVNLKLLKRAASSVNKQPVIVTNNQALTALAGGLNLYVAKNLQTKPVLASSVAEAMPEEEALEVSDSVEDLAEGESVDLSEDNDNDEVELTPAELAALAAADKPAEASAKTGKKPKKNKTKGGKIPNFDGFRKKLLIGGAIALLLVIGLFAIFGRTKADIVVRAQTTPVDVAFDAIINANTPQSDPASYNLKAQLQESKKTLTQSFPATGERDDGTPASGQMTLTNCTDNPVTVPSGTGVSSGEFTFITQSTVRLNAGNFTSGGVCRSSGNHVESTRVVSQNNGDRYNLSARNYTVNGIGGVTGRGGQMSGGTSKIVKIVSQADIDRARGQLDQQDSNAPRQELTANFGENVRVLEDSFVVTLGNVTSEPAVGQEANEGRLTVEATYTLLGVERADFEAALDAFVATEMTNQEQQRVYDNGYSGLQLEKVSGADRSAVYRVAAQAYYGPQFDIEAMKTDVSGKKFGEVRSYLQDLPGVKGVDINLSPFWARNLPNESRININLEVDDTNGG